MHVATCTETLPHRPVRVVPEPAPIAAALAPAARGVLRTRLELVHAGSTEVEIRWERVGVEHAPLVVVQGGISADRHVVANALDPSPGWWETQGARGSALEPRGRALLAIDWLGADGALDVPIDTADQAAAIAAVLDALGVARIAAFVGASYGAMTALAFAARTPRRVGRIVAISGADRAHPDASAWRAIQRRIVALGGDSAEGVALARALAMLGYRSAAELGERFDAPARVVDGRVRCASEDWLDACGERFAARFPARAFVRLSESIDLHRVDPAAIAVPTTLVGIEEDRLVPFADLLALASALAPRARLVRLSSRYGHDAFLKEPTAIDRVLCRALRGAA